MPHRKKMHPVDLFVGEKLRELRKKHGFSQTSLGQQLELSHQQVQQYEQGVNRIAASTLFDIARIIGEPVASFFDGIHAEQYEPHAVTERVTLRTERNAPLEILLVEPDADDEMRIREACSTAPHTSHIHSVRDGREAILYLRNRKQLYPKPDIILLELTIHDPDGISLLRDIRRDKNLRDIPAVALTNSMQPDLLQKAGKHQLSGYYIKCHNQDDVKQQLHTIIAYWWNAVMPSMQY